jgi:hypothetical protein
VVFQRGFDWLNEPGVSGFAYRSAEAFPYLPGSLAEGVGLLSQSCLFPILSLKQLYRDIVDQPTFLY